MSGTDDLYINDGAAYDTSYYPEDQDGEVKEQEVSQKAVQAASYPIMGDVAEWFEEQIKSCDSIDNIIFDTQVIGNVQLDRNLSVEVQVLAYRLLKEKLQDKARDFEDFRHER